MTRANYIELNKTIKPMNKNTVKSIERNSARFIYVNKEKIGKCECCNSEFALANTKHLDTIKCPSCKREGQIIHSWRRRKNQSIHWEVLANAIDNKTLVLRYYLVVREDGAITESEERARYFFTPSDNSELRMENSIWDNEWLVGGRHFFREYGMAYCRNSLCCLEADIRGRFFEEAQKVDALKYLDIEAIWGSSYYATSLAFISTRADIYEKLQKVGLNALIIDDLNTYTPLEYNKAETEVSKMLGINKNALSLLKTHPTKKALEVLRYLPNLNEREFDVLHNLAIHEVKSVKETSERIKCSVYKVAKYINEQRISVYEYSRYITQLKNNKYSITDKSYTMPKDFNKEVARLTEEERRAKAEFEAIKNNLIKAIHDKLNSTPQLREYFNGAKGFLVNVPMSEQELIEEGKAQHNCVGRGHYADAIAKNETLVFFVRERHNPKASFVTMEYCNGAIVQCMFDHNERVGHDTKVYQFCSALANTLSECDILSA